MAAAANGPGSHRTEREAAQAPRTTSRLRRRAPAIEGSADRSIGWDTRTVRRSECGTPPNEGGTAEGTTFRPEEERRSFLDSRAPPAPEPTSHRRTDRDDRPAEPDRSQAPRRHGRHDPAARHAHRRPRDADRRVPAPRRRHDARLPARVRRGRRAARALQLPGRRAAAAARGGRRRRPHDDPSGQRRCLLAGPARSPRPRCRTRSPRSGPSSRAVASSRPRACRGSPAAPSARSRTTPSAFEPSVPATGEGPGRRRRWRRSSRPTSCWCSTTSATSCRRSRRCTPRRPTSRAATGSPSGPSSRPWSGPRGRARPR